MRRILLLLGVVLLLGGTVPCSAEPISVSAVAAVLMDADTGQILYEKNGDRQMGIASTTKILTALTAMEQGRLQQSVTISERHMVEGSSMSLRAGERLTLEELLYGLMLCSGNDAALAVAECCCGSVDAFVAAMNRKARHIGMSASSFANPHGLDAAGHFSTARDMACLAAYAAKDPAFIRFCSTVRVEIGGRTMTNHNRLLRQLEGCIGMKTGYTSAAGRTLVSCVVRDGRTLVAVTLNDGDDWADHQAMYAYGFDRIKEEGDAR